MILIFPPYDIGLKIVARAKSRAASQYHELQENITATSMALASTTQSLQRVGKKIKEVTNMLQLLQSKLLDLEKEVSLEEQVIKDKILLEGVQSEALKVDQSLQSTVINLDKFVDASSFYQKQRS